MLATIAEAIYLFLVTLLTLILIAILAFLGAA